MSIRVTFEFDECDLAHLGLSVDSSMEELYNMIDDAIGSYQSTAKGRLPDHYTHIPRSKRTSLEQRLADIEAEDREYCSNCGGEDCICCPIYLDRMTWEDDNGNPLGYYW